MNIEIIPAEAADQWHKFLKQTRDYDFYHLPEYHLLAEEKGEGKGSLFVYQEDDRFIALPLLIRPVEDVTGLFKKRKELFDATSVYGYCGPVCSPEVRQDTAFLKRFATTFTDASNDMNLVSVFSRLHPLIENDKIVSSIGCVKALGDVVVISLEDNLHKQWSGYRKSHRYEIRRARKHGFRAFHDEDWLHFGDFIRLYKTTMESVKAHEDYFFDEDYFSRLRELLGDRLNLFVAELEGTICSAALFVHTGKIIQYHLSGSDPAYNHWAPSKLIIDEARQWGNTLRTRYLHLGGGVGSRPDNLYHFKAGFSSHRRQFYVWELITMPDRYAQLVEERKAWRGQHGEPVSAVDFFPAYRTT